MKEVKLTKNQVALVDDEDYERVNKYRWRARYSPCTKSYYALRNYREDGKHKSIYMHRYILNAAKGQHVDHANRDTLDNRKENISLVTKIQNERNKRRYASNISGVCGVWRDKKRGKWIAEIRVNNKKVFLGGFDLMIDAKKARKEAESKFGFHINHGSFQ